MIIGCAVYAYGTPCIISEPCPGVDYFLVKIDDSFYVVYPQEDESFKADFEVVPDGWHEVFLIAVYLDVSMISKFTLVKETIKNKSYYTIYPAEGYDVSFGEKLFTVINNRAGKEVGGN